MTIRTDYSDYASKYGTSTNETTDNTQTNSEQSDVFSETYENPTKLEQLKANWQEAKNEQGVVGDLWDGFKNIFNTKYSSDSIQAKIDSLDENATQEEISEVNDMINSYKEKQDSMVNIIGDVAVGTAAIAAIGTGGLSVAALGAAAAAGAITKVGVSQLDNITDEKEGNSFKVNDLAQEALSGSITGVTSVIGNAAGGKISGIVGKKLGLTTLGRSSRLVAQNATQDGIKILKTVAGNAAVGATGGAVNGFVSSEAGYIINSAASGESSLDVGEAVQTGLKGAALGAAFGSVTGAVKGASNVSSYKTYKEINSQDFDEIIDGLDDAKNQEKYLKDVIDYKEDLTQQQTNVLLEDSNLDDKTVEQLQKQYKKGIKRSNKTNEKENKQASQDENNTIKASEKYEQINQGDFDDLYQGLENAQDKAQYLEDVIKYRQDLNEEQMTVLLKDSGLDKGAVKDLLKQYKKISGNKISYSSGKQSNSQSGELDNLDEQREPLRSETENPPAASENGAGESIIKTGVFDKSADFSCDRTSSYKEGSLELTFGGQKIKLDKPLELIQEAGGGKYYNATINGQDFWFLDGGLGTSELRSYSADGCKYTAKIQMNSTGTQQIQISATKNYIHRK